MKFLIRFYHFIVLTYILLILIIFKLYNNFYFKNNESIIFIIVLLLPIIILTIIRKIEHNKKYKFYTNYKNDYQTLVNDTYNEKLLNKLNEITTIKVSDNYTYFGLNYNGIIIKNKDNIEIRIKDTLVSIKYYFGKTINNTLFFDKTNYQYKPIDSIYFDILNLLKKLLNGNVLYLTDNIKKPKHASLFIDNTKVFTINNKKQPKYKNQINIKL